MNTEIPASRGVVWAAALLLATAICASCARPAVTGSESTDQGGSMTSAGGSSGASSGSSQASSDPSTSVVGSGSTGGSVATSESTGASVATTLPPIVGSSAAVGGSSTPLPECRADKLPTLTAGTLTIATSRTASAPWFTGDDPKTGQGFEAAVAYAVAARLGYSTSSVSWVRADRSKVIAGTADGFDVAVQELSAPARPGSPVDYSTGYFSTTDAVVVTQRILENQASSLAGLKSLHLGVVSGSTAQTGLRSATPGAAINSYPTPTALLAALRAHQIQAAAIDTPTALSVSDLSIVGVLPAGQWQPDQLSMVLPKGSKLTSCISAAIDTLRAEGTLTQLAQRWLRQSVLR